MAQSVLGPRDEETILQLSDLKKKKQGLKNSTIALSFDILDKLKEMHQVGIELLRHFWGHLHSSDTEQQKRRMILNRLELHLHQIHLFGDAFPMKADEIHSVMVMS